MDGPAEISGSDPERCWLCERPLGRRIERHHPVPKSRGGRETVPVHPICHRTIHATLGHAELQRLGAEVTGLRSHPDLARFLAWIATKPADFHAITMPRRTKGLGRGR
ncbi:HNH endonuclease [Novosphingobium flavum]|uniref:HNH endonuclease n=1 Tax=Novosphingobium aerophilum TaxID=2839843 RepID=A0A7X1F5D8_9SPHN|nr:HNH endonuclease [Novosphingobium aerophilum]MBC2650710.1 HNH endonuclease [Novosphingobium aerophilum]MBC2662127.1 HNH endonuclease [Novosphingobium aerophilum]